MLNISKNKITIEENDYEAFSEVTNPYKIRSFAMWLLALIAFVIIVLFLPWTQNIQVEGRVTSLRPSERPQMIHAVIPGIIQQWYVAEGQVVSKGDTLVRLSEMKTKYINDDIITRKTEQLYMKRESVEAYKEKIRSLLIQKEALEKTQKFKYEQTENKVLQKEAKVKADKAKLEAAEQNLKIANTQLENTRKLFEQNLKSLSEYQEKQQKAQEKQAKYVAVQNQLEITKNELLNMRIKLTSIEAEYAEKISKVQTYIFSTKSDLNEGQAMASKLRNELDNLVIRRGYLYITAPQDGYVTKALQMGLGQTVKEGTSIVSIMPKKHQLAAELYVDPVDLPLIGLKHQVRLIFDGWPTFVFSGWPDASYGTFAGQIVAVDNMISDNGKYRILVSPIVDENTNQDPEHPWPIQLRLGSGCKGMALLNDVPVWKEIWRQLNGFPQDFYDEYKPHPYEHHKSKKGKKKQKK